MKRASLTRAVGVAATAALALMAATGQSATADAHESPIPPHAHILVIGAEVGGTEEEPVLLDYRKCVDIAANRALPLGSQHEHVHFGRAGEALFEAGHLFVPVAPAFDLQWTDCASFLAVMCH